MRNHLLDDFREVKNRKLYYILFAVIGAIAFYAITLVVSAVVSYLVGESNNQNVIEGMILNGGTIPVFFAVVLCAPLVEELVYRKSIFKLLENKPIIYSYLVSVIAFVLPHMISTPMTNIGNWLLLCIPYFVSAILLCLVYQKSNKNIWVVWGIHMFNNLIAFILILLTV